MVRASQVARRSHRYAVEATGLGERIRRLRISKKWTLEHAAEQADLDLKHLQKIEAGQLNVTLVTLVRISNGLGVPIAQLFKPARRPK